MASGDDLREQLESLHAISVEIAALHEISEIHERALNYGREMTASEFASPACSLTARVSWMWQRSQASNPSIKRSTTNSI